MFQIKLNNKNRRLAFVGVIFLISICSLFFIIFNFKSNIVFFFSPSEIEKIKESKGLIRIGGMIKTKSIEKIDALSTSFIVTDYSKDLKVVHRGILPDLFRENQGVVAKGKYNIDEDKFYSDELLVKHDENYMPPEVAKNLKMKVSQ